MRKQTIAERIFGIGNASFLLFFSLLCILPLYHVFAAALSNPAYLAKHDGVVLWPIGFTLKGYELVLKNPNILNGYLNSFFYVVVGTSINILFTSVGAYALSRKKVLLATPIMMMITFTMFFNGGLIPFFLVIKGVGFLNTRLAIIIPYAISVWHLIVMRTSFQGIPDSLTESAKIDGANDWRILFQIVIPVSKALVAVMVLFYGVGHWNSWFPAMIFLRDRAKFPIQLFLREILISADTNSMVSFLTMQAEDLDFYRPLVQYCTIMVATVPILCIYPLLQKHFVKGVLIGSIKG